MRPVRRRVVALVVTVVALAFMVEVMRAGVRIPEDLSVVGHDDQPIAAYCPVPLTSMTQPADRIAQAVVNQLLTRVTEGAPGVDGAEPRRVVTILGDLIERSSVAPPAAEKNTILP